jgi:Bacterial Ig domain/Transmembrane protein 131-like N-terminal
MNRSVGVGVLVCSFSMACGAGVIEGSFVESEVPLVETSTLVFPEQPVGVASAPSPVVVKNTNRRRKITLTAVRTAAPFSVAPLEGPIVLAPRASTTIYVTFSPTAPGTFSGSLVCTFANGHERSYALSGVGVGSVSDPTPPIVNIISPAAALTLTAAQSLPVVAAATDDVAVARVEFYDGATLLATDSSSPYEYLFAVTMAANGTHSLTARAFDASGNSATSDPRVLTVNIQSPPSTYSATLLWDANVEADLDGYFVYMRVGAGAYSAPIAAVGEPTYTASGLAAGTYSFRVSALNTAGLESPPSAEVTKAFP